jgi:competence protein ComEA
MKLLSSSFALLLLALPPSGWSGPVNINSADAATIARELKGVGLSKAEAIVEYRQKHGPFRSADELAQVRGIGQKRSSTTAPTSHRPRRAAAEPPRQPLRQQTGGQASQARQRP